MLDHMIETVLVESDVPDHKGFLRINKADFVEGVHKLYEGSLEALNGAEQVLGAVGGVFTAEAGGTPVAKPGAGQPGDGGPAVAGEGSGGWGSHPVTPPPVQPQEAPQTGQEGAAASSEGEGSGEGAEAASEAAKGGKTK